MTEETYSGAPDGAEATGDMLTTALPAEVVAPTRLVLPTNLLQAAMLFAARDDVRYYLNAVCVEVSADGLELYLVATDGHRMFAAREKLRDALPSAMRREWLLAIDDLATAAKGCDEIALLGFDGEAKAMKVRQFKKAKSKHAIQPSNALRTSFVRVIDGKFPAWRQPVKSALIDCLEAKKIAKENGPSPRESATVPYNLSYLYDCQRAHSMLAGGKSSKWNAPEITITKNCAVTLFPLWREAVAITMPMSVGDSMKLAPWMSALAL